MNPVKWLDADRKKYYIGNHIVELPEEYKRTTLLEVKEKSRVDTSVAGAVDTMRKAADAGTPREEGGAGGQTITDDHGDQSLNPGDGAYITFSPTSQGTLFIHWSKERPKGDANYTVLAWIEPGKQPPAFKYKTNGGRIELSKKCLDNKVFYREFANGVAKWIREWDAKKVMILGQLKDRPQQVAFNHRDTNKVLLQLHFFQCRHTWVFVPNYRCVGFNTIWLEISRRKIDSKYNYSIRIKNPSGY